MANKIDVSVPAGDHVIVVLASPIDLAAMDSVVWQVFAQQFGVPDPAVDPLITKTTDGHGVDVMSPPDQIAVTLLEADTVGLLRNYYHEATALDGSGNRYTLVTGTFTVTQTENR